MDKMSRAPDCNLNMADVSMQMRGCDCNGSPKNPIDLDAIREVIAQAQYLGKANSDQLEEWADKLARALGDTP